MSRGNTKKISLSSQTKSTHKQFNVKDELPSEFWNLPRNLETMHISYKAMMKNLKWLQSNSIKKMFFIMPKTYNKFTLKTICATL